MTFWKQSLNMILLISKTLGKFFSIKLAELNASDKSKWTHFFVEWARRLRFENTPCFHMFCFIAWYYHIDKITLSFKYLTVSLFNLPQKVWIFRAKTLFSAWIGFERLSADSSHDCCNWQVWKWYLNTGTITIRTSSSQSSIILNYLSLF